MSDPFSSASTAILAALSASASFTTIVAPGNLIDPSADSFERFKPQLQSADTPEVVLIPDEFQLKPFGANSRTASLSQSFTLIATHDSLRTTTLNALKFSIMTALLKSGTELGIGDLVRSWEIHKAADDFAHHPQWRRGGQRWISLMTITVQMELDRSHLLASQ